MQITNQNSFQEFLDFSNQTLQHTRNSENPWVQLFERQYVLSQEKLWPAIRISQPVPLMLAMNAFIVLLSAVRTAMSGNSSASYPLYRAALESSCYAALISARDELAEVWIKRKENGESYRSCRAAFTGAVKKISDMMELNEKGSGGWILEAYEASIDFGGHPNVDAIFKHMQVSESEEQYLVNLIGVHGAGAFEIQRALIAANEYALAIAIVLANFLTEMPEDLILAIGEVNDDKDAMIKEYMLKQ